MATTWGHAGRTSSGLYEEPADDVWTTTLGDLVSTYDKPTVVFMRVEIGEEAYHLTMSNDLRAIPQGSQVLVK